MKIIKKTAGFLLSTVLLFSAAAASVSAQPNSGVGIIPIVEPDFWQVEAGDNGEHEELNGPNAYAKTTLNEDGSILIQRNANSTNTWVSIATMPVELMPSLDLTANPYLYVDLECNTQWNISLTINGQPISMAKGISTVNPSVAAPTGPAYDGNAGTFKGKINLKEYLAQESDLLAGMDKVLAPAVRIYIVDTTADNLSGRLTINQLAIGNDDPNSPEGIKLNTSLITGDDPDADPGTDDTTATAEKTTTTAADKTTAASKTTASQTTQGAAGENGGNTLTIVLIVVAAVVVAGVVAAVVIIRKRKSGTPPDNNDQPQ